VNLVKKFRRSMSLGLSSSSNLLTALSPTDLLILAVIVPNKLVRYEIRQILSSTE